MIKKVAIVSLSSGMLGEDFIQHELDLGLKRLEALGLEVSFTPNALKGIDYLKEHPEARASDLIAAFEDPSVDMILCAIGGDDTHRLSPYLFDHEALKKVVKQKVFLGFSDTTINHLMLHQLGIKTFYGQSFLADVCELESDRLPYSRAYFEELVTSGQILEIKPSPYWYEERKDFSAKALGTKRVRHLNRGFELLKGSPTFSGEILGGYLESLYQLFDHSCYDDSVAIARKYQLFPSLADLTGKILLLEISEEKPDPLLFEQMLKTLKETGIFSVISGLLVGKPIDETHKESYREILLKVVDTDIPILYNLNVGHATPRAIVPFGVMAEVDAEASVIRFKIDS
ncbi:S66 family peptidase [Streptococcus ictaluri]|uniref:LD-carboxypeptidase n=1 Tax=Streptococcus ictaluri 707-05 TaxID=764299 RepID=G5K4S6_9STRE|nr:S66 peptidase family protein [Streptococcus ictaluri]EHI69049.1 LD-carboxypeptidase [Streptococcus ictaluri 707-05]